MLTTDFYSCFFCLDREINQTYPAPFVLVLSIFTKHATFHSPHGIVKTVFPSKLPTAVIVAAANLCRSIKALKTAMKTAI